MAIVIGIAGYSGSGKTTLLEKLISDMKQQGLKIGVIKHSSHDMDLGKKDTAKFFYSGADEVITSGKNAVLRISKPTDGHGLTQLVNSISSSDVIFVEGYKKADIPKIVVLNSGLEEGYELLMDQNTRAVIIDDWSIFECIKKHYNYAKLEKQKDQNHGRLILSEINLPVFIRDDIEGITHFIKCCFCN